MNLKSIVLFYSLILIPLVLLGILSAKGMNPMTFAVSLVGYAFIYHPSVCGIKLLQIGKIDNKDFFKNFIPLWNKQFFKDLYFH